MSDWRLNGSTFSLHAVVPANTTATIYVPTTDASGVTEGGVPAREAPGVELLGMEDYAAVYSVGSGRYEFESPLASTAPAPASTAMPGTWTFCANEGEACAFTGTRQVRYGAGGLYSYATFTDSAPCTNRVFGNPVIKVLKHCEYNNSMMPTPWWTPRRVMTALGAMGALLLAGVVWVSSLRRTVQRQTQVIHEKLAREAAASERSRIAREIHDGLAQAVAGISMQLETIRLAVPRTASVALERLESTRALVRQTLVEASRSIWEIQVPAEPVGLEKALRAMLERFGPDAPVFVSVAAGEPRVAAHVEYHLVRIAQEAIANALRHAEGAPIRVDLTFPPGRVVLRITDNGPGFSGVPSGRGAGLSIMRDRASILGGELHVRSTAGQGTEVSLDAPSRLA